MSETKNYKLYVTDDEEEDTFDWVQKMNGENENSNIQKIDKILGDKADLSKKVETVLLASGWSDESPYEQTISIDGITADTNGVISVGEDITMKQLELVCNAILRIGNQSENSLTIVANGIKPDFDIPVVITLIG